MTIDYLYDSISKIQTEENRIFKEILFHGNDIAKQLGDRDISMEGINYHQQGKYQDALWCYNSIFSSMKSNEDKIRLCYHIIYIDFNFFHGKTSPEIIMWLYKNLTSLIDTSVMDDSNTTPSLLSDRGWPLFSGKNKEFIASSLLSEHIDNIVYHVKICWLIVFVGRNYLSQSLIDNWLEKIWLLPLPYDNSLSLDTFSEVCDVELVVSDQGETLKVLHFLASERLKLFSGR